MRSGENWTSDSYFRRSVLDLDETLQTFTFTIWKCLGSGFAVFILICMLISLRIGNSA